LVGALGMGWPEAASDPEKAVGEVFSVDGQNIDIFVYPQYLPRIRIGDILAIEVEWGLALAIVLDTSYRAQRSFRALRLSMEALRRSIPDIYRFHVLLTRAVYTSRYEAGVVEHMRGGTPMLHALVYRVEPPELVREFFMPRGSWDLSFLQPYVEAGATPATVKHLFRNHRDAILPHAERDRDGFVASLAAALRGVRRGDLISYLRGALSGLGWVR